MLAKISENTHRLPAHNFACTGHISKINSQTLGFPLHIKLSTV